MAFRTSMSVIPVARGTVTKIEVIAILSDIKITVVQDMADTLGLTNVKTYHGRAESISGEFSWVVGRSVSSLPTYCFWIHHLLEKKKGG